MALHKTLLALLTSAALLAVPAVVQAQEALGVITAYKRDSLRAFDAEGRPLPAPVRASDLPANAPIVATLPGGGLGVRHNGQVIYLRGIDVDFQLTGGDAERCLATTSAARPDGALSTGTHAGGGTSRDCRVGTLP